MDAKQSLARFRELVASPPDMPLSGDSPNAYLQDSFAWVEEVRWLLLDAYCRGEGALLAEWQTVANEHRTVFARVPVAHGQGGLALDKWSKLAPFALTDVIMWRSDSLKGLSASPYLDRVRRLDLVFTNPAGDAEGLFEKPLTSLMRLGATCTLSHAALKAIGASPHLDALRALQIRALSPSQHGLAGSSALDGLRLLAVGSIGRPDAEVLAGHPTLETLDVIKVSDVSALIARPLPRLRRLVIQIVDVNARELLRLLEAHAGTLEELEISGSVTGLEAHAPDLPQLRSLAIHSSRFASYEILSRLPRLERLELSSGTVAGRALVASPAVATVKELCLSNNTDYLDASLVDIISSSAWAAITSVAVRPYSETSIVGLDTTKLKQLPATLRRVDLEQCRLTAKHGKLGRAFHAITDLSLGHNGKFGVAGVSALAASAWPALERLSLRGCQIGSDGTKHLAESTKLTGLRALDVSNNQLGDTGLGALLEAPWLGALTRLNLANNNITSAGATTLAKSAPLSSIRELDLSQNDLGDEGITALANAPWTALEVVQLHSTKYGVPGTEALRRSTSLPRLVRISAADWTMPPPRL